MYKKRDSPQSNPKFTQWILEAIHKIKKQKQRASKDLICKHVVHGRDLSKARVEEELQLCVRNGSVLRVFNKGVESYKDPLYSVSKETPFKKRSTVSKTSDLLELMEKAIRGLDEGGSTIKSIEKYIRQFHHVEFGKESQLGSKLALAARKGIFLGRLQRCGYIYRIAENPISGEERGKDTPGKRCKRVIPPLTFKTSKANIEIVESPKTRTKPSNEVYKPRKLYTRDERSASECQAHLGHISEVPLSQPEIEIKVKKPVPSPHTEDALPKTHPKQIPRQKKVKKPVPSPHTEDPLPKTHPKQIPGQKKVKKPVPSPHTEDPLPKTHPKQIPGQKKVKKLVPSPHTEDPLPKTHPKQIPGQKKVSVAAKRGELLSDTLQSQHTEILDKIFFSDVIDEVKATIQMLPVPSVVPLIQKLCKRMETSPKRVRKKLADKEFIWDLLARRHLSNDLERDQSELASEESKCQEVFDIAVMVVPTATMWTMYIQLCVERLEMGGPLRISNQRAKRCLDALGRAYAVCGEELSQEIYEKWMTILQKVGQIEESLRVGQLAVNVHSSSAMLWCKYLEHVMLYPDDDQERHKFKVRSLFDKAVSNVESKEGIKEDKIISIPLKEWYIQWAFLKGGLKVARQVYAFVTKEKPVSEKLFQKYIDMENARINPKVKRLRSAYEDALMEYGRDKPDMWLDYIKLEMTHPKGDSSNISSLYDRAMQALERDYVEEFTIKYHRLQAKHESH